tara:strand:+ start:306 stop:857 length:552 start_codon:yes stop_codon:yes gene_type:complete
METKEYDKIRAKLNENLEKSLESIKQAEAAIKAKTQAEQYLLRISTDFRDSNMAKIFELNKTMMNDKTVHPIVRVSLWVDASDHTKSDWILNPGPTRDIMLNNCENIERHQTFNVIDHFTNDFLWDICYEESKKTSNKNIIVLKHLDHAVATFDSLPEESREKITLVINDLIEQNISEFTNDW